MLLGTLKKSLLFASLSIIVESSKQQNFANLVMINVDLEKNVMIKIHVNFIILK